MLDFVYIQDQKSFDQAVADLRTKPQIALDTESSGYFTYYPEICLIQISALGRHYIIDTLQAIKLDALGAICKDPSIVKIFHAAAADIRELKHSYNWEFQNIFDTFLACRLLGHASCSLVSLVEEYEGIVLQKKNRNLIGSKGPLLHPSCNMLI